MGVIGTTGPDCSATRPARDAAPVTQWIEHLVKSPEVVWRRSFGVHQALSASGLVLTSVSVVVSTVVRRHLARTSRPR